jgi:hypothetical protein
VTKNPGRAIGSRLFRIILALEALPLIAVIALFAFWAGCDAWDRAKWGSKRFTPEAWHSATPDSRHLYANDLLSSNTLAGRTPDEVRTILGTPDREERETLLRYTYTMKWQDCSVIPDHWLLAIEFSNGRVHSYGLTSD